MLDPRINPTRAIASRQPSRRGSRITRSPPFGSRTGMAAESIRWREWMLLSSISYVMRERRDTSHPDPQRQRRDPLGLPFSSCFFCCRCTRILLDMISRVFHNALWRKDSLYGATRIAPEVKASNSLGPWKARLTIFQGLSNPGGSRPVPWDSAERRGHFLCPKVGHLGLIYGAAWRATSCRVSTNSSAELVSWPRAAHGERRSARPQVNAAPAR